MTLLPVRKLPLPPDCWRRLGDLLEAPEASMLEVEWMFFNNWQCTELAESSSAR
jgi:hypothetical protein